MGKKRFKNAISLMLVCCITLTLAACSEGDKQNVKPEPTIEATAKTGPSWSWDTSPFEIGEWYVGISSVDMKYDPVNKVVDKAIFEKTGLQKVSYTTSPTAADEKLSAMIASQMLPDVITLEASKNAEKINLLQSGGLVEELLPLIEKYAPGMKSELNQDVINWRKASDGKWYAFPSNTYTGREVRPMTSSPKTWMFARTDILQKLNLKPEDFKTQDGFVAALKKFKNAGITSNGAPMLPILSWEINNPYDYCSWLGQFFAIKNEDKNGNYLTALQTPEFWEFMGFMNRLYREDLLTEQNILMKTAEAREIALKDGFFMDFGFDAIMGQIGSRAKETNGSIYYTAVEIPRNSKGENPIFTSTAVSGAYTVTFITKNAKNKDRIIRLFDFLNSKEGNILAFHGIEGMHYDWINALVPQTGKTEKVLKVKDNYQAELTKDKAAAKKKYGTQEIFMLADARYNSSVQYQQPYEEKLLHDKMMSDIWDFNGKRGEGAERYSVLNDSISAAAVAPDPDSEASDILAKINVYMMEQGMKLLTAKTEAQFKTLQDETMKRVTDMGLMKLQKAQNDKFQAVKAKFGIKYSYPQLGK